MTLRLLLALLLVLLAPVAVAAQEGETDDTEGTVEVGAWDASTDGSPDKVTEYEPNDGGPDLRLRLTSELDWGLIHLGVAARDGDDQDHLLDFDVRRSLRSSTRVQRLLHRLGHRPLDHFNAATNHGRVARHTDTDPAAIYEIGYRLLEHRTEYQPVNLGALTLAAGYRRQEREGLRQATVVSHCDGCHVVSRSRPVDERTTDLAFEVQGAWSAGRVRASINRRDFENRPGSIPHTFDDALQPELRIPVFDNRVQYDSAQGPLPIAGVPEVGKDTVRVDGVFDDVGGLTLAAEGVWSTTKNETTGLEASYDGYLVSLARRFAKGWSALWRGRVYTLDNDDVFVDVVEPVGIAGPQAGRTYREIYDFDPDFLRRSALNRDVTESRLDVTKRLGRKSGRLRFSWDFEEIDRETFEVAPGETKSTTNTLGLSWWARPAKGWKTRVALEHGETDNPFVHVDGAFSTLRSPSVSSPFDPSSAQYYEFQNARIADGAAEPSSWDELELRLSRTRGQSLVTATLRYWDGDNDEGDLTDWSKTVQAATLGYWAAPAPKWQWHVAWAYNDTELEAPASIPLFDG